MMDCWRSKLQDTIVNSVSDLTERGYLYRLFLKSILTYSDLLRCAADNCWVGRSGTWCCGKLTVGETVDEAITAAGNVGREGKPYSTLQGQRIQRNYRVENFDSTIY
jgi:hypothetical protein